MDDFNHGGNYSRRFLIRCNGKSYTSYDKYNDALAYVAMQKGKVDCPKGVETYAVKASWEIRDQGARGNG